MEWHLLGGFVLVAVLVCTGLCYRKMKDELVRASAEGDLLNSRFMHLDDEYKNKLQVAEDYAESCEEEYKRQEKIIAELRQDNLRLRKRVKEQKEIRAMSEITEQLEGLLQRTTGKKSKPKTRAKKEVL